MKKESKILTRRHSIKQMGLMGAAATVITAGKASAMSGAPNATAFALIGDRFHNSHYIRASLGKTLVKEAGLSIDFTDEAELLNADTLKNYKMLIVFRDGMNWPNGYVDEKAWYPGNKPGTIKMEYDPPVPEMSQNLQPEPWIQEHQGKAIREFVENGGSAFFFHNNSNVSCYNEDYRYVQGGFYTGHPPIRPFWVKIQNHDHPITRGVKDFLVTDEQHYMIYTGGEENVLALSEQKDQISYTGSYLGDRIDQGPAVEAVWAYELGEGRVCFMGPGHMIGVMWNPEYEKMQKNAVKWLLREA
jgi:type 1 glutamine amidotransferase